jgi:hypothetical protein
MNSIIQIVVYCLAHILAGACAAHLLIMAIERVCDWLAAWARRKRKRGH